MTLTRLIDSADENIWAGTVFRFPAQFPFEDVVDFMLIFDTHSESGFSLVCSSGSEAGNLEYRFPKSACAEGNVRAISKTWLIENWLNHVYADTHVKDIYILVHYPVPEF